jgi:hypothetical protein
VYDDIQRANAQNLGPEYGKAFQNATQSFRGCLFSSAANCGELIFPNGFNSVYEYDPPGAFGRCFTGLPVPIIVVVYNKTTFELLFDFPPFLPTQKSTGKPFAGCQR